MNEVLFENRFVRDESTAKEIYGHYFFKRPLMITLYVLIGLNALLRSISLILGTLGPIDAFITGIFPLLIIPMMFVAYRSQVKALVGRDAESAGGGEFFNELRVTYGDITITTPISSQSVGLDKMKYAFMTKGYICVVTEAKLMYIFKKDSFLVGDGDSFLAFLRQKGIKVRGKKTV